MFACALRLLIALAVACLPLGVARAAQTHAAADCCASHSARPTCPDCPAAPNGGLLSCCAGAVVLAPFSLPVALRVPSAVEAVRTERAERWMVRRERPPVPPPRQAAS